MRVVLYEMTRIKENRGHALHRGRPKIRIDEEQLEFLVENSFRTKDIALIFGCTPRTIERQKADLQLTGESYSSISDTELIPLLKK